MINFQCDLCKVACTGDSAYKQHMEGSKHRKKQLLQASILGLPEPPAIVFDQGMPGAEANVSYALPSTRVYECSGKDNSNSLTTNSSNQQASNTKLPTTEPQQLNNYFCRLCNVCCTGPFSYQQHMDGRSHAKQIKFSEMFSSGVNADTRQNITSNTYPSILSSAANISSREAEHAIDHKPMDCTPPVSYPVELTFPINKDSASGPDTSKESPFFLSNTANIKVPLGEEPQSNPTSETRMSETNSHVYKLNQITSAPRSPSFQNGFPPINYNCSLCQVVCTSLEQHDMHVSGKQHAKKLKLYNAMFPVTHLPANSVVNAFEHTSLKQEPPHDQNPTVKMENGVITNLDAVSKPDINECKHDVLDQNLPSFSTLEVNSVEEPVKRCSISDFKNTTSNARCNICNVSISGEESYNQHIQGRQHQKKLTLYMHLHPNNGASATDIFL